MQGGGGRQAQGARARGAALEVAVPLERLEVVVDGRRRGEADRLRDLAHGRRVAARAQRGGDVIDDPLLAGGVVLGHRRLLSTATLPNVCSIVKARSGATAAVRPGGCYTPRPDAPPTFPSESASARLQLLAVPAPRLARARSTGGCCWSCADDDRVPWSRKAMLGFAAALRHLARSTSSRTSSPSSAGSTTWRSWSSPIDLFLESVPHELMIEKMYELGIDGRELERDLESVRRVVPAAHPPAARRLPDGHRSRLRS